MNARAIGITEVLAVLALALALPSGPVHAHRADGDSYRDRPGHSKRHVHQRGFQDLIDRRQDVQGHRIVEGRSSGALTPREARRLAKEQRHIRRLERRFRSDGWYSRAERRQLRSALDDASQRIWRLKHNERERYGRGYSRHGDGRSGFVLYLDDERMRWRVWD